MPPDNRLVEAELMDVQTSSEPWSQYLLGDGTTLKLKVIVTEIWRAIDVYDNDRNPLYVAKSNNVLVVNSPDEIRKKE